MKLTSQCIKGLFILLTLITAISCDPGNQNKSKAKSHLPVARGEANAILAVMDTAQWNGRLGQALRDIFSVYVPGLPQDEPYFKLRNINPLNLNSILKTGKSMIFVSTWIAMAHKVMQCKNTSSHPP